MKRSPILLGCLLLLYPAGVFADLDDDTMIHSDRLTIYVRNTGGFGRAPDINGPGLFYPAGTTKTLLYAAGLWLGGKINGEIRVSASEYGTDFRPGQFKNGAFYNGADDSTYKVYGIQTGDTAATNPDYADWPIDQGAPAGADGRPLLSGDQTLYAVYTDSTGPGYRHSPVKSDYGLGVEVRQTVWAYQDGGGPLSHIIFVKYLLLNRGGQPVTDVYMGLWSDPDLGGAGDDLVGCDITLNMAYCYNGSNRDSQYDRASPALGFSFLQGPITASDNPRDRTVLPDGSELPGMKMLGITAFQRYDSGTAPWNFSGAYASLQGLYWWPSSSPSPMIDPVTGQITRFMCSGDPVTSNGWLDFNPSDRYMLQSTGPFNLPPWQDSDGDNEADLGEPGVQEIILAVIVGNGQDRLSSVSVLRYYAGYAGAFYANNFRPFETTVTPQVSAVEGDEEIRLSWDNRLENEPPAPAFRFEGYNIYQYAGAVARRIATFDAMNDVTTILQPVFDPQTRTVEQRVAQVGRDSGLQHTLSVTQDALRGGRLRNGATYEFGVTAYFYNPDPVSAIRVIETEPQRVKAVPQKTFASLDDVKVVPNPYFAYSAYQSSSGTPRVQFMNLPPKCTIRIFNLAGDLVNMLEKDDASTILTWDLLNVKRFALADGVYLWHVQSDYGEKTGKLAVFWEERF